jgi:hypothetical protein
VKSTERVDVLLGFYDCPAGHGIHLRTSNPIKYVLDKVWVRSRDVFILMSPVSGRAGWGWAVLLIAARVG